MITSWNECLESPARPLDHLKKSSRNDFNFLGCFETVLDSDNLSSQGKNEGEHDSNDKKWGGSEQHNRTEKKWGVRKMEMGGKTAQHGRWNTATLCGVGTERGGGRWVCALVRAVCV